MLIFSMGNLFAENCLSYHRLKNTPHFVVALSKVSGT